MSTPEGPDEQDDARTAEQPPVSPAAEPIDSAPIAAPAAAPSGSAGPPPGPPLGYYPGNQGYPGYQGYPPAQPHPFAPRVREPWLNPAKRGAFSLVAVVLALVLLGGGFVIGAAAAHRHDRNQHSQPMRRFEGQPGFRAPQGGQQHAVVPGNGRFKAPRGPVPGNRNQPGSGQGQRSAPATPAPSPSSSHS